MAHGFLQALEPKLIVCSAVVETVDERAVEVMREVGIDISKLTQESVETYLNKEWDYVILVDGEDDKSYPVFRGGVGQYLRLDLDYSICLSEGDREFVLGEFRRVREQIRRLVHRLYVEKLMEEPSCPCGANYFCRCE